MGIEVSHVLTESLSPLDMLSDISLSNRWLDSCESLHEVIHADRGAPEQIWLNVHKGHGNSLRVRWEGWGPASILCLLESLSRLATSHWHHQSFIDNDGQIGTRVSLRSVSKFNPILIIQVVFGF